MHYNNFLLSTSTAERLYYTIAADLPLIDYHNHLSVIDLAEDRMYKNISEAWLLNDPYKHRAMRICGIDENLITGNASDREKFNAWCEIYPKLIGNPLYDWSRLELQKILKIQTPICKKNSELIWSEANELLQTKAFTSLGIYNRFSIKYAAPCASILDDLSAFFLIQSLAPSLRGDDLITASPSFIKKLSALTGIEINDLESFQSAITHRLNTFQEANCRFSDHALDNGFIYQKDDGKNNERFKRMLSGKVLSISDKVQLSSVLLRFLAGQYAQRNWTMQLHIGAQRYTSTKLRNAAGGAGGFACIGNSVNIESLVQMLDDIELGCDGLPRIILYTLNPSDNAMFSVLSGSFRGVMQGPAWWWCDHLQGMREMLDTYSSYSVLGTFVGMTTDSRSLFSLSRHDYFRQMLCGWIGQKSELGEFPNDFETLCELVRAICFENASRLIE